MISQIEENVINSQHRSAVNSMDLVCNQIEENIINSQHRSAVNSMDLVCKFDLVVNH